MEWNRLDRLIREHAELERRTMPLLKEIEEMTARYQHARDFEDLTANRKRLREQINVGLHELEKVEQDYRNLRKEMSIRASALGFTKSLERKDLHSSKDKILESLEYNAPLSRMSEVTARILTTLINDHDRYEEALIIRRARFRSRLIMGGVGGLLFLLFVLSRWVRRNRTEPVPASAPPGSGPSRRDSAPPAQASPEIVGGHFRLEDELGRGGMGVVFRAVDTELERPVAIKRMRDEVTQSKKELEMFLAEARLVAALKHPALVEIHSFFREEDSLYLVFELVEGRPLHEVLEKEGRLSLDKALEILRPVAEGLDYAHSKRVIHRDLKPSNIMVCDGGAKIMDFGIAHQAKKTVAKVTHADAWGTPPYMAPEQELGRVTRESDIYSLGACAYEMLTGEAPFPGPDFLKQKRERDFVPPTRTAAGLPAGIDPAVARALEAEPEKRFHSAIELVRALQSARA